MSTLEHVVETKINYNDIIKEMIHEYENIEDIQSAFIKKTENKDFDIINCMEELCKENKDYLKILIKVLCILYPKQKKAKNNELEKKADIPIETKKIEPVSVEVKEPEPIVLSEEQQKVIDNALNGDNIFLSGNPGTGKSFVIKHLIKALKEKYFDGNNLDILNDIIGLAALTGAASVLIGATTIHSFLKIGLARNSAEDLYGHVSNSMKTRYKFNNLKYKLKVLIIDEISMMDIKFFEKISDYLKLIKNSSLPFGGIQIILSGDFHQIPPVEFTDYIFNSRVWKQLNLKCNILTKSFRQEGDIQFQELLNNLRIGKVTEENYKLLLNQKSSSLLEQGFKPVKLYSTNLKVDNWNNKELENLHHETKKEKIKFKIIPNVGYKAVDVTAMRKQNNIPDYLELIEGAQVMVTFNINTEIGLINGTLGVVKQINYNSIILTIDNGSIHEIPYINCNDPNSTDIDNPKVVFSYLPIKLAYAVSIHKSQGCSLSLLEVDLSNTFGYNMSYTAVSRCRSLDGLIINGLSKESFKTDSKIIRFYESINNN